MSPSNPSRGWALGSIGLAIGLLFGFIAGQNDQRPVNPQLRALDSDLWIQTSAEYHACCLQTFRLAGERLTQRLAKLPSEGLPPAVILDLDETVLDNSPFQTWLFRQQDGYAQPLWDRWEQFCPKQVRLVPGAKGFIELAERAGVTVAYISNRNLKYRNSTIEVMEHLGLNTRNLEKRLLLSTNTSNKDPRREEVRRTHRVVMLVGDNLRDFSDEFRAVKVDPDDVDGLREAITRRKQQVDHQATMFGSEWIILPNPVYGEWQRLEGRRPVEVLNPGTVPPS